MEEEVRTSPTATSLASTLRSLDEDVDYDNQYLPIINRQPLPTFTNVQLYNRISIIEKPGTSGRAFTKAAHETIFEMTQDAEELHTSPLPASLASTLRSVDDIWIMIISSYQSSEGDLHLHIQIPSYKTVEWPGSSVMTFKITKSESICQYKKNHYE